VKSEYDSTKLLWYIKDEFKKYVTEDKYNLLNYDYNEDMARLLCKTIMKNCYSFADIIVDIFVKKYGGVNRNVMKKFREFSFQKYSGGFPVGWCIKDEFTKYLK